MRLNLGIGATLFLLTFAVFWPVTGYDFVNFDDPGYVSRNAIVQKGFSGEGLKWAFTTNEGGNWAPVTWFSHMLDCQLFSLNAGRQHATSVALHGVSVVLLFFLLSHLTGAQWRSALVAALFSIHPLRVESVAWISERKDVLSGLFFMFTVWCYVLWVESRADKAAQAEQKTERPASKFHLPSFLFYLLALILFALGLMSKAMIVTLPVILLLLDVWPLRRFPLLITNDQSEAKKASPIGRLVLEKVPFFIITIVMSAVTIVAQK